MEEEKSLQKRTSVGNSIMYANEKSKKEEKELVSTYTNQNSSSYQNEKEIKKKENKNKESKF